MSPDDTAADTAAITEHAAMTLTVPADARWFRSVRLAIGGVATLVGFDVEAIDDIRIGVDELCGALAEAGSGGDLTIEVDARIGESLRIVGTTASGSGALDPDRAKFSHQILSVVADDHGLELDGDDVLRCWLERSLATWSDDDT